MQKVMLFLSSAASSSTSRLTASMQICPLYLKYGPVRRSRSFVLSRKTSRALPRWFIRANPILGSNPKMRFNAQRHAFSSMFSMPQSKNKTSFQTISGSWLCMVCVRFFLFLMLFSFFLSDDKECISVRTELVVHLESCLVCLHHVLVTSECSY